MTKKIILDGSIYIFGRDKKNSPILILDLFKLEKIKETDFIEQALFYLTVIIIENMMFPFFLEYFNIFLKIGKNKFFLKRFSSILKKTFERYFPYRINKLFIFSEENVETFDKMDFFGELIKINNLNNTNKLFKFIDKKDLEKQFYGNIDNLNQFWPPQTTNENRTILISDRILESKNLKMYKILNSHKRIGLLENWMEDSIFMNSFYDKKDFSKKFPKKLEIQGKEISPIINEIVQSNKINSKKKILLPNIYGEDEEIPFGEFAKSIYQSNFQKKKIEEKEKVVLQTQVTEVNMFKTNLNKTKLLNKKYTPTKKNSLLSNSIKKEELVIEEKNQNDKSPFYLKNKNTVEIKEKKIKEKNLSDLKSETENSRSSKSQKSNFYKRTQDLTLTNNIRKRESDIIVKRRFSNLGDLKNRKKKSEVNYEQNYNPHTYKKFYKFQTFKKKGMVKSNVNLNKKKKRRDKDSDFLSIFCCGGSR